MLIAAACAVVGVLAALGKFDSIPNFPIVFALICLVFGLVPLGRQIDFTKAQKFLGKREITCPTAITDRVDVYVANRVYSPPSTALVDDTGRVLDYAIVLMSARALMQRAAALGHQPSSESSSYR